MVFPFLGLVNPDHRKKKSPCHKGGAFAVNGLRCKAGTAHGCVILPCFATRSEALLHTLESNFHRRPDVRKAVYDLSNRHFCREHFLRDDHAVDLPCLQALEECFERCVRLWIRYVVAEHFLEIVRSFVDSYRPSHFCLRLPQDCFLAEIRNRFRICAKIQKTSRFREAAGWFQNKQNV